MLCAALSAVSSGRVYGVPERFKREARELLKARHKAPGSTTPTQTTVGVFSGGRASTLRVVTDERTSKAFYNGMELHHALLHENTFEEAVESEVSNRVRELMCVTCMSRPYSVLAMPCAHAICCLECRSAVSALRTCPHCRAPIARLLTFYR